MLLFGASIKVFSFTDIPEDLIFQSYVVFDHPERDKFSLALFSVFLVLGDDCLGIDTC